MGTVLPPAVAASKLVEAGKLRIGWLNCRIRAHGIRCFRYLEIAYTAKNCKSAVDRSAQCFRCDKEDHKVVYCPLKSKHVEPMRPPIDNGEGTANKF